MSTAFGLYAAVTLRLGEDRLWRVDGASDIGRSDREHPCLPRWDLCELCFAPPSFGRRNPLTVSTAFQYHHQDVFIMHWASSAAVWLWSSAIADVSISLAAAYSLKSRIAGFNRETDSVLRTLIFIVLRTAAYTAIISIVVAAVESVYKDYQLQSFVTAS